MEVKVWVLDRIEQTFNLFKNNFIWLFLPFFLYNFISIVIIWTISNYYMMSSFAWIQDLNWLDFFGFLNNSTVVIWIIIWTMLFILYLLFYVVILLWFLKSVKQAVNSEKITISDNVKYWISRFMNSMKTYWYIFAYIALIPSIIFIFWWLLFNAWYYFKDLEMLKQIWWFLMILGWLLFIVFAIYRWIKASFPIYSAVNDDNFTKENFNISLKITDNNWWRIIWNFMLLWILVSLVMSLIWGLIWIIWFLGSWWSSLIDDIFSLAIKWTNVWYPDMNEIKTLLNNYVNNFSVFWEILSNTIDNILTTISSVFVLIFTYMFFLRLQQENNSITKPSENKQTIEL
jgi:hypothetical protein